METLLEQQRRYHEESERIIDAMVKETIYKKNTQREIINSEHRQKILLDRHMDCAKLLKEIYEDKDGQRKEEVALLSGPNEFVEFYNRLKQIKEFYKKHPNEVQSFIYDYSRRLSSYNFLLLDCRPNVNGV